jgi:hypothetical protein
MDTVRIYDLTAVQMGEMLQGLLGWLDKAEKHAKTKEMETADVFMQQRLIADQYSLVEQIQSACDAAKFACARLTGKEPPKHPDTEKTLAEARTRIQSVLTYLKTYKPEDFKSATQAKVTQAWMEGKFLTGTDYLAQLAIPNFYFHLTTAYSILRANGVDVGKSDFIARLDWKDL